MSASTALSPADLMLPAAEAWTLSKVAIVRVKLDGSKEPAMGNGWQAAPPPSVEQVRQVYAAGYPGLGVRCGAVSGGLEMWESEGRGVVEGHYAAFEQAMRDAGLAALWARLTAGVDGYRETSPSGGVHLLYRVDWPEGLTPPGNTVLAARPSTADELADRQRRDREHAARRLAAGEIDADAYAKLSAKTDALTPEKVPQVIFETRGEGGFVVVAPSHGPVSPSERAWTLEHGRAGVVPLITVDERDALFEVARCFDLMPKPAPREAPPTSGEGEDRPGDDYNARADWSDVLEPHFTFVYERGGVSYWRRSGKDRGVSASTGYGSGDWLYVHSTSTLFDAGRTYTKFGAYTVLEHDGKHALAAAELRRQGYGGRAQASGGATAGAAEPASPAQEEWPELEPLTTTPPPVPTEGLPAVLAQMVQAAAANAQAPVEIPLTFALGALSAATRGCWSVDIYPGWGGEPTAVYAVALARSGERKSAGKTAITAALDEAEKRVALTVKAENRDRELRRKAAEARRKKVPEDEDAAIKEAAIIHENRPRPVPALVLSDTTTEALGVHMQEQGGAAALMNVEATAFRTVAGAYSDNGGNVGLLNQAYGAERYADRRIKRAGVTIHRPFLAWAAAVQPEALAGYANATTEGSGFLGRFLLLTPESLVGRRVGRGPAIPDAVQRSWDEALASLHARAWDHYAQMTDDPDDFGKPLRLAFSDEAAALLESYKDRVEVAKLESPDLRDLGGWIEKHPARLARIAALFALLENPYATTVGRSHIAAALTLAGPFIEHATAAMRVLRNETEAGPVRRVEEALRALGQPTVTTRDVYKKVHGQGWVKTTDDVRGVLAELAERERLRREKVKTGGAPSEAWHVHPSLLLSPARPDDGVAP